MVQKITPLFQWKIESGQWKIVLNNFPLSIFNLEKVGCNSLHQLIFKIQTYLILPAPFTVVEPGFKW